MLPITWFVGPCFKHLFCNHRQLILGCVKPIYFDAFTLDVFHNIWTSVHCYALPGVPTGINLGNKKGSHTFYDHWAGQLLSFNMLKLPKRSPSEFIQSNYQKRICLSGLGGYWECSGPKDVGIVYLKTCKLFWLFSTAYFSRQCFVRAT